MSLAPRGVARIVLAQFLATLPFPDLFHVAPLFAGEGLDDEIGLAAQILSIVVIDLVLSGDNAVVIGMAARRLSPENRRKAILYGGAGAVVLRILFTALAAVLLDLPYLLAFGGALLLWVAWRLVQPSHHEESVSEAESLGQAVRTIILADVVMSLDNILAVGGAAHGDLRLLLFGLLVSIPILLLGSELVARVLGRYPGLLYLGVFVLVHTAVSMLLEDEFIANRVHLPAAGEWVLSLLLTVVVSVAGSRAGRPATA